MMSAFLSSLIELAIKGIPEGLLDVLAIYIFTKTPFEKKKFLFVSAPFIIAVYITLASYKLWSQYMFNFLLLIYFVRCC
jgi:hypothetical protein